MVRPLSAGQQSLELSARVELTAVTELLRVEVELLSGGLIAFEGDADLLADAREAVNESPPITFRLSAPALELRSSSVQLYAQEAASSVDATVFVRNAGGGTLDWTATSSGADWLTLSQASGSVATLAESPITLSASPDGLAVGDYSASVTLSDPAALDAPQTVSVDFSVTADPTYQLGVAARGDGNGRVISSPGSIDCLVEQSAITGGCGQHFPTGTIVTLSALASEGSTFIGWDGACAESLGTCEIVMDRAQTVVALFERNLILFDEAAIELTPSNLVSTVSMSSDPDPTSFRVRNIGATTLRWSALESAAWFTVTPATGTLEPGSDEPVTVAVSSAALPAGSYSGSVAVSDPSAINSPQSVAVGLTVTSSETVALTVAGVGTGTGRVTSNTPAVDCIVTAGQTLGDCADRYVVGTRVTLVAAPGPGSTFAGWTGSCSDGSLTCEVEMTEARSVTAEFALDEGPEPPPPPPPPADPPAIDLTPTSLAFSADEGQDPDQASQPFTITNSGGSTLDWQAAEDAPWLTLSAESGSLEPDDSAPVTVTVASAALAPGDYETTITVADPDASNSPQVVTVTLTVTAEPPPPPPADPPAIDLAPTALAFSADEGQDPDQASQPFTITNSGGSTLDWQAAEDAPWLTLSAESGSIEPDDSAPVTVTVASAALAPGDYETTITVADPDASNSPQVVTVSLTVTAEPPPPPPPPTDPPAIDLTPTSLAFSADEGQDPDQASQPFTITNSGGSTLDWQAAEDAPWLTLSAESGSIEPDDSAPVTVTVASAALAPGDYETTITVADPDASNSPQVVTVTLAVTAEPPPPPPPPADPPAIDLAPTALAFSADEGQDPDQASQPFTITNSGGSTLDWQAAEDAPWLTLSAESGSLEPDDSAPVTVTVASAALAPGDYETTITVADPDASNSPQVVTVSLTVTAEPPPPPPPPADPPAIDLTPTSLAFSADEGEDPDPDYQPFTVTNSGGSTLDWQAAEDAPWLTLSAESGSLEPDDSAPVTVTVASAALAPGDYETTITVADPDASNSPQVVTVSLTVTAEPPPPPPPPADPPTIDLAPTSLAFSADEGEDPDPDYQPFTITNSGGSTLDWQAAEDAPWLTLSAESGSLEPDDSAPVTVTIASAALAPGDYETTITVADPDASNSPQVVTVTLTVVAAPIVGPAILVTPDQLDFEAEQGSEPIPNDQLFTITNIGTEPLSWRASENVNWLTINSPRGVLDPGESESVRVIVVGAGSLPAGELTTDIVVSDPAAVNSPQTVRVRVTVTAPSS